MVKLTAIQYAIKTAISEHEEVLCVSDCGDYICVVTPTQLYYVYIDGKTEVVKL